MPLVAPMAKSLSAVAVVVVPIWRVNWPLKAKSPRVGKAEKPLKR